MIRAPMLRRPVVTPRALLAGTGAILIALAVGLSAAPGPTAATAVRELALAERLGAQTWALAIPVAWLAAPVPGLREDDVLDLLGTRAGERATATEVATGLRVMSADDRTVVVELTGEAAASIAAARARGLALVPILRSRE